MGVGATRMGLKITTGSLLSGSPTLTPSLAPFPALRLKLGLQLQGVTLRGQQIPQGEVPTHQVPMHPPRPTPPSQEVHPCHGLHLPQPKRLGPSPRHAGSSALCGSVSHPHTPASTLFSKPGPSPGLDLGGPHVLCLQRRWGTLFSLTSPPGGPPPLGKRGCSGSGLTRPYFSQRRHDWGQHGGGGPRTQSHTRCKREGELQGKGGVEPSSAAVWPFVGTKALILWGQHPSGNSKHSCHPHRGGRGRWLQGG